MKTVTIQYSDFEDEFIVPTKATHPEGHPDSNYFTNEWDDAYATCRLEHGGNCRILCLEIDTDRTIKNIPPLMNGLHLYADQDEPMIGEAKLFQDCHTYAQIDTVNYEIHGPYEPSYQDFMEALDDNVYDESTAPISSNAGNR